MAVPLAKTVLEMRALKITTEPLENRQLHLTIEVDEERAQQAMRRAARQIGRHVSIPGFRKGKAPYDLIVQRYGEDAVRKEAAESLAEAIYREALEQEEIAPYAPGVLEDAALHPITFKFTVPLRPTVDLGNYRDYRLKPPKVKVSRKQVQQALKEICKQNVILEPVDRPVALGDGAVFDLVGRTGEGTEFIKWDEARILLEAGSTEPAPGFAEAVVGMEAGEERTFTLTLPDDFPQEEVRGQEAEFTVRVSEVYESTLPELDDDLARTVGNFDSLKELKKHIKEQLQQAAQQKADEEYAEQVLEAILEQTRVGYPPVMLEETLDEMAEEIERRVKRETHLSLEDYLRFQGKTIEELREELEPSAAVRLKRALMLGEVVRLEELEVDEEEVGAHIEKISAPWGIRADEVRSSLSSDKGQEAVRSRLLANKALQRLVAIAKGEAPEPVSIEEQEGEGTGPRESGEQETENRETGGKERWGVFRLRH
ncbi:MAG: trigger factor [Anaerolineae bacterium]